MLADESPAEEISEALDDDLESDYLPNQEPSEDEFGYPEPDLVEIKLAPFDEDLESE
jgi:hypothetical protein